MENNPSWEFQRWVIFQSMTAIRLTTLSKYDKYDDYKDYLDKNAKHIKQVQSHRYMYNKTNLPVWYMTAGKGYFWFISLLKYGREIRKMKQAKLAKKFYKHAAWVSKYESGYIRLDLFESFQIIDALNIQKEKFANIFEMILIEKQVALGEPLNLPQRDMVEVYSGVLESLRLYIEEESSSNTPVLVNGFDWERFEEQLQEKSICFFLKLLRKELGVSQKDLAKALQQPQSFISKIERGERRIDFSELAKIAFVLGVSLVQIVESLIKAFKMAKDAAETQVERLFPREL